MTKYIVELEFLFSWILHVLICFIIIYIILLVNVCTHDINISSRKNCTFENRILSISTQILLSYKNIKKKKYIVLPSLESLFIYFIVAYNMYAFHIELFNVLENKFICSFIFYNLSISPSLKYTHHCIGKYIF